MKSYCRRQLYHTIYKGIAEQPISMKKDACRHTPQYLPPVPLYPPPLIVCFMRTAHKTNPIII